METGRCFQVETMGAVDGPGLRLVLFLQGCPLRCPYCHNPESWAVEGGREITVDGALALLRRYRAYYKGGGLTVSGGEPLLQAGFVAALLWRCREEGYHTALDTSGCVAGVRAEEALRAADLVLLDIKCADEETHRSRFGFSLARAVRVLDLREKIGGPVWVRQVTAHGITDSPAQVVRLRELARRYTCVEKVELLPFRSLCLEKYRERGIPFPMAGAPAPTDRTMRELRNLLAPDAAP